MKTSMKFNYRIFLITLMAATIPWHSSFASKDCTQGPACEQLNETVKQIKEAKEKRHHDVQQYGRNSSQVKNDDLALTQALQKDHDLRDEQNAAKKPIGHHRSRHHASHKHHSQVS